MANTVWAPPTNTTTPRKYLSVHSHVSSSVAAFTLYHLVQECIVLIVFMTWKTHRGSVELVVLKVHVMILVGIKL